jgi:hypothetical protein
MMEQLATISLQYCGNSRYSEQAHYRNEMKQNTSQNDSIVQKTAVLLAADIHHILVEKPMNFFEVLEQMHNTAESVFFTHEVNISVELILQLMMKN